VGLNVFRANRNSLLQITLAYELTYFVPITGRIENYTTQVRAIYLEEWQEHLQSCPFNRYLVQLGEESEGFRLY
jgi:hypothetical protein